MVNGVYLNSAFHLKYGISALKSVTNYLLFTNGANLLTTWSDVGLTVLPKDTVLLAGKAETEPVTFHQRYTALPLRHMRVTELQ